MFWSDGSYYIGEFDGDKRDGFGEMHHVNGKIEAGNWEKNVLTQPIE